MIVDDQLDAAMRRVLSLGGTATAIVRRSDDGAGVRLMLADAVPEDRAARTAAHYGLTRAEARVLALLCDGCALPQVAEILAVARTTVRTHLQRIFDKTDARRQGDLLRLVLSDIDRPRASA